jgi:cytochrome c-type biogenesis protein
MEAFPNFAKCAIQTPVENVAKVQLSRIKSMMPRKNRLLGNVMFKALMFVLGFSLVFITLGAGATKVGQLAKSYKHWLGILGGAMIFIFGLHLTGLLQIKALYADKRMHNLGGGKNSFGAFMVGFAFAFGWTPCIGPILGAILALAMQQNTLGRGVMLLAIYSAGLAVPFLLTALSIERFLAFYARFRQHLHKVEVASGVLLIFLGLLIGFDKFTYLNNYLGFLNRWVLNLEGTFSVATPITAFVAGIVSFLSPCVLPLVPGYVSLISGTTVDDLQQAEA